MALTTPRFQRNKRIQNAANSKPSLKKGETSEGVEILQQALSDLGFSMPRSINRSGLPDGIFGSETEATVKSFQARQGLTIDGIAGKETFDRLDTIFSILESAERSKLIGEVQLPPSLGKRSIS
jgi:peptidoglycan hydrolase-like protein with peptidoglycan-binding domain